MERGKRKSVGERDGRFNEFATNPIFQKPSRKRTKVAVDDRFKAMFEDPAFADIPGLPGSLGEPEEDEGPATDMGRYYELDSAQDKDALSQDITAKKLKSRKPKRSKLELQLIKLNRLARGQMELESSESEEESEEEAEEKVEDQEIKPEINIDPEYREEETSRLALVNCDWDNLRAVDIFAIFQSFLPAGGKIKRVTVFPSDYGLKKMEEEQKVGPGAIFKSDKVQYVSNLEEGEPLDTEDEAMGSSDEEDGEEWDQEGEENGEEEDAEQEEEQEEGEPSGDNEERKNAANGEEEEDSDNEETEELRRVQDPSFKLNPGTEEAESFNDDAFDPNKLREYELNKLKYYYAVIECRDVKSAATLYNQCDGKEIMLSSNIIDLRFVPDDVEFTNQPRDSATRIPEDYQPNEFATSALQSTRVKLTWDEPEQERVRRLNWERNPDMLDEEALAAYIAPGSDGESEDEEEEEEQALRAQLKKTTDKAKRTELKRKIKALIKERKRKEKKKRAELRKKYKALLSGESVGGGDVDMEVTFKPQLGEALEKKLQEKKEQEHETVFEAQLRREKEKRRERRLAKKARDQQEKAQAEDNGTAGGNRPTYSDSEEDMADLDPSLRAMVAAERGEQQEKEKGEKAAMDDKGPEGADEGELALLTMPDDEEEAKFNFSLPTLLQYQKLKRKKKLNKVMKAKLKKLEAEVGEQFDVDTEDPRFQAMFNSSEFAIDPNHQAFKDTDGMRQVLHEHIERRKQEKDDAAQPKEPVVATGKDAGLSSLVSSLKSKMKGLKKKGKKQIHLTSEEQFKS